MSKGAKALTGPRQMVKQFEMASMAWQGGAGGNWQPSGLAAVGSYAKYIYSSKRLRPSGGLLFLLG